MEEVRPDYYRVAGMETMSVIRAVLTEEEFCGFVKGNVLKYRLRAGKKTDDPTEDIRKAETYESML